MVALPALRWRASTMSLKVPYHSTWLLSYAFQHTTLPIHSARGSSFFNFLFGLTFLLRLPYHVELHLLLFDFFYQLSSNRFLSIFNRILLYIKLSVNAGYNFECMR